MNMLDYIVSLKLTTAPHHHHHQLLVGIGPSVTDITTVTECVSSLTLSSSHSTYRQCVIELKRSNYN